MPADDLSRRISSELQATVAPLTELVGELDAAIAECEATMSELRELRRNVKRVLGPLEPKRPEPPKRDMTAVSEATRKRAATARAEKKNRVHAQLLDHGPSVDITVETLASNGLGDPPISRGMLYELLRELRDEGVLRLDRKGAGGQAIYRLVASRE